MSSCHLLQNYCAFQNTDVFSEETFGLLSEIMVEYKVQKGTFLFAEHETANKIYFVRDGQIKITKTSEDGKELMFHLFQKGDLIGELGTAETHSFSGKATMDSVIEVIYRKDLETILSSNGKAALEFIKWMDLMNRITSSKLRDLLLYGKNGALCSTLIRLSNSFGKVGKDGISICIKLTNTELAELIGTSRETVNRMLASLKKTKVIDFDSHGYLRILDLDYLRMECRCEDCPIEVCRI
ncbi:Crp/Fnr family transcriptional regulator [Pseudalkalibacillus sp. R45]|uniref:Crp/Fnr family transcriptional regulator n=1 Tax=Pseudalkalibacillus sp. R45 TaxID=3457433 RepID=UPI003FCC4992